MSDDLRSFNPLLLKVKTALICVLIFLVQSLGYAAESTDVSVLLHEAQRLQLFADIHWHKLLHYKYGLLSGKSDIVSPEHFLAVDGNLDPAAELIATINAFFAPKTSHLDQHAICRFPARYEWLNKRLAHIKSRFPTVTNCPAYERWTNNRSIKSVSVIFATGYLGNPASYFGHPLMKLNFEDGIDTNPLLDHAINYGAFSPASENPVSYALKGLFGGYLAGFTSAKFFFHNHNYSEIELRDLWQYELQLSDDQISQLTNHLWELMHVKFPYYFTHDNCAYRMSELLELVIPVSLTQKYVPFAIPSTLFYKLVDNDLVKSYSLLESRQSRMTRKYHQLRPSEKRHTQLITQNAGHVETEEFSALNRKEQSRILEVAFDHYEYRRALDLQNESLKGSKIKLLSYRTDLPPGENAWEKNETQPPHRAQRPVLTQIKALDSKTHGSTMGLRVRPAYYDLVSPDDGRLPYSSLSIMDTELQFTSQRLWLQNLNFISVETLNVSQTYLPGDGGLAWRFKLGLEQLSLACTDCLVARLEGGVGKAWEISKKITFFTMIEPRLHTVRNNLGPLSGTVSVATLLTPSRNWRLHASAGKRYYANAMALDENLYLIESRWGSSPKWDVRLHYQDHIDRRWGVSYGRYW